MNYFRREAAIMPVCVDANRVKYIRPQDSAMLLLRFLFPSAFLLCVCFTAHLAAADPLVVKIKVEAGKLERSQSPVAVSVALPMEWEKRKTAVTLKDESGQEFAGQLTAPALLTPPVAAAPGAYRCELHFVLPRLEAGKSLMLAATISEAEKPPRDGFSLVDKPGEYAEILLGEKPALRYMCAALDETTPESRSATFKPYHHLYDPTGERLVTKGPGGLFPHHRGLFFGFNRISYADAEGKARQADVWHCNKGEYQSPEGTLAMELGPVLARQRVAIDWHGQDKQVFAREQRELSVYNVPGGRLVEFASRLTSQVGKVKLDGDPQHAGFQFRASQEVPDKTAKQTYYLRPDGKGEPGKFRNWPADKGHVNLPWHALSFVLADQRYTCCYLDRPDNPKEARFSERDYGRFGSYFEYELDSGKPLQLNYRIWLQAGEMTGPGVQALDDDFVTPATAVVLR